MRVILFLMISTLCISAANASPLVFFGKDLNENTERARPIDSGTEARSTEAAFKGAAKAHRLHSAVEDFEHFNQFQNEALRLRFYSAKKHASGTAVTGADGAAFIFQAKRGATDGAGRYPHSGRSFLEVDLSRQFPTQTILFDRPVMGFGFYATDIGDFGSEVAIELSNGSSLTIPTTAAPGSRSGNGSLAYFGLLETDPDYSFDKLVFKAANGVSPFFGLDDLTIVVAEETLATAPLPGGMLLLGAGLGCLVVTRRARKTRQ